LLFSTRILLICRTWEILHKQQLSAWRFHWKSRAISLCEQIITSNRSCRLEPRHSRATVLVKNEHQNHFPISVNWHKKNSKNELLSLTHLDASHNLTLHSSSHQTISFIIMTLLFLHNMMWRQQRNTLLTQIMQSYSRE
jgi:hypothetical protein